MKEIGRTEKGAETDAYMAAMRILAIADNSTRRLSEKLRRKGYAQEEIAEAVLLLSEKGYLNDHRLALRWGELLAERRCCGAYKVRMELLKQFDREIVDSVMTEIAETVDFQAIARKYAKKNAAKGRETLIRRLKYQGFSVSEIRLAVEGIPNKESRSE